jgi:hypothetical protein
VLRLMWMGGDISIHPHQALSKAMVRRLARALAVILRHPLALGHVLRRPGLQRPGKHRLVRTARAPTGALDGRVHAHRAMALRDRLGPAEDPDDAIEPLVRRAICDHFLLDGDLLPEGDKATVPAQGLSQGTQAGTACRQRDIFRHGARLCSPGDIPHRNAFDTVYLLAGVRFTGSLMPMITPLHGAKNWQLAVASSTSSIVIDLGIVRPRVR